LSLFDVPPEVLDARPRGAKDFVFPGAVAIHHRKLAERLVGCQTRREFRTPAANQLILGGLGNIDHRRTEAGVHEGVSLRLSTRAPGPAHLLMDTNGATLFLPLRVLSPVVGLFRGTIGRTESLSSSSFADSEPSPTAAVVLS
jgi:hypothetical protein